MQQNIKTIVPYAIAIVLIIGAGVFYLSTRKGSDSRIQSQNSKINQEQPIDSSSTSTNEETSIPTSNLDEIINSLNSEATSEQATASSQSDSDTQAMINNDDKTISKINQDNYDVNF